MWISWGNYFNFLPRDATKSAVLPRQVVCLSVRNVNYRDHIDRNSSKIILELVSLGCSLFSQTQHHGSTPREHPEILAGRGVGTEKLLLA